MIQISARWKVKILKMTMIVILMTATREVMQLMSSILNLLLIWHSVRILMQMKMFMTVIILILVRRNSYFLWARQIKFSIGRIKTLILVLDDYSFRRAARHLP